MEVEEAPLFDIESYASKYSGYARLCRLKFIAEKAKTCTLKESAYRLLDDSLKSGINTTMYNDIFSKADYFYDGFRYDGGWVDSVEQQSAQRLEKLESELRAAKSSMIMESVRIVNNDLGDFYYERGNLIEAMKAYSRTREFTSMPRHDEEMALNVVTVSVGLQRLYNISNFSNKVNEDIAQVTKDKLRAAQGLLYISQSDYKNAALTFLQVEGTIIGQFSHVMAAEDVAIFGAVCGIASLDRPALRDGLLGNRKFRNLLELTPDMRQMVQEYLDGKYISLRRRLELQVRPLLEMDIYFSGHVKKVYKLIMERIVVQYFSPYSAVDLTKLSIAVDMPWEQLEVVVCDLITRGRLEALIDIEGNTLVRKVVDKRTAAMQAVLHAAETCEADMSRSLLRLSLMSNHFIVSHKELAGEQSFAEKAGHLSYIEEHHGDIDIPEIRNDDMEDI